MGRILSYNQLARGNYPTPADFSTASKLFCEQSQIAIDSGVFESAAVFGSVARGTPNIRSDFDAIMIGDDLRQVLVEARRISGSIDRATNGREPFSPIAKAKSQIACGMDDVDRFFGVHILSGDC
jgi:predicted nucleotidyltransferase